MKSSPIKWLFIGGGLILALRYLADKTGTVISEAIKFGKPKARNFQIGVSGLTFQLDFELKNELPFDLPQNSFIGQLAFNDTSLGAVTYPAIAVAAGTSKTVTADIDIKFLNLANNVISVIQNPQSLFQGLFLRGNITSNGIQVPVNEKVTLI